MEKEIEWVGLVFYPNTGRVKTVKINERKDSFELDNTNYKINIACRYADKNLLGRVKRYYSYYVGGTPEPLVWGRDGEFTAEELYAIDVEGVTERGVSDLIIGQKRRMTLGRVKWLLILLIAIGIIMVLVFFGPQLTGMLGKFFGGM